MSYYRKSGIRALAALTIALLLLPAPGAALFAATGELPQTIHVDPLPPWPSGSGGDEAPQPRWPGGSVTWLYDPAGAPASLTPAQAVGSLQAAMAQWSARCNVEFVYGGVTARPGAESGYAVVAWNPAIAPAVAVTRLGHAAQVTATADVVLNPDEVGSADALARVAVHQLGHALGLAHTAAPDEVMSGPPLAPYSGQQDIGAEDAAACAAVYGLPARSLDLLATTTAAAVTAPVPVCSATASHARPPLGSMVIITPKCTGAPTSHHWTGCLQIGTACVASTTAPGPKTYLFVASNAYGPSAPVPVTLDWQGGAAQIPTCSVNVSNTRPVVGQSVTFTAACTNNPTRYAWTNCSGTASTCTATATVAGLRSYGVAAGNAGGTGPLINFSVDWQAAVTGAAGAPVCTLAPGSANPALNSLATITATCSGAPSSYAWTGCWIANGNKCYAMASARGPVTYTLRGANAIGAGAPVSTTLTWGGLVPVPACTVAASSSTPIVGGSVTLTATCTNAPTSYAWTQCASSSATCTATSAVSGARAYAVTAANAGGTGVAASVSVDWQPPAVVPPPPPQPPLLPAPACTVTASNAAPAVGGSITLTANCSEAPTTYAWTHCSSAGATCTASALAAGTVTYAVTASNAGGTSAPATVAVAWLQGVVTGCNGWPTLDMGTLQFDGQRAFSQDYDGNIRGGFGNRMVAVTKLQVPANAVRGTASNVAVYEYAGPMAWRRAWLSKTRCDLSAKAPAYASESGPHIYLSVGVPRIGSVTVQPGETWYLMVVNQSALFGNIRDTCYASGYCEIGITAYPFN